MRPVPLLTFCAVLLSGATTASAQPDPAAGDSLLGAHSKRGRTVAISQTTPAQAGFDALDYDLSIRLGAIDLTAHKAEISGQMRLQFRAVQSELTELALNLAEGGLTVTSVTDGAGRSLSFTRRADTLHVALAAPLASADTGSVTVAYQGRPISTGFGSFMVESHGPAVTPIVATLSEPFGARDWWPSKDDPADKATLTQRYTVPVGFKAAGNGSLVSDLPNGDGTRTVTWRETYPISTYLVTFATTNYVEFGDTYLGLDGVTTMPVVNYVYPEHLDAAKTDLDPVTDQIRRLALRLGEYPFIREKYGHAIFPWPGGMEHQTMTSLGSVLIRGDQRYTLRLFGHELGHQWFGDRVTMTHWRDIWLNEGFASYCEALLAEAYGGRDNLGSYMRDRFALTQQTADSPVSSPLYDIDPFANDAAIYDKGARVLHALRFTMGDTAFFAGLRDYLDRFSYGNATTDDLRRAMETHYTPLDPAAPSGLGWFFDEWVTGTGRPALRYSWTTSGSRLSLTIEQTQPNLFATPLQTVLTTAAGPDTLRLWLSQRTQTFDLPIAAAVSQVDLDPFGWVPLTSERTATAVASTGSPDVFRLLPASPNPFNPTTAVRYQLSAVRNVKLQAFNSLGQRVRVLVDGPQSTGLHTVSFDATGLPTGVYLLRLVAGNRVETQRVTLVR